MSYDKVSVVAILAIIVGLFLGFRWSRAIIGRCEKLTLDVCVSPEQCVKRPARVCWNQ